MAGAFDDLVPAAPARSGFEGGANAAASGFANGVPIVGPVFNSALDKGVAGIEHLVTGQPYADLLAKNQTQESADNTAHPTANRVGGVAGALASTAPVIAAAPALFGAEGGALTAGQLARGAASGAAIGGADAEARGNSVAGGATLGALGGGAAPAIGAAVGGTVSGIGRLFNRDAPAIMSSAELAAARDQAYATADNAGLVYSPEAIARLHGDVQDHMAQFGYAPELQPGGAAVLRGLNRSDGMPTTLTGLDTIRKTAGNMYSPTNPSSSALGGGIRNVIDDFTANPRAGDVMMGDQAAGVDALMQGRALNQRASKDDGLAEAIARAQDNAGASGSGGNINNATRQQLKQLQNSRQDWTPDEQDQLTRLIQGTPASNLLRQIGKLSPEGNGLMQRLDILGAIGGGAVGGTSGALAGAALPAAGFVAKRVADAGTARGAATLGDIIRAGGTRAATQATPNAVQQLGAASRGPITAATLGALYAPQPGQYRVLDGLPAGAR